MTSTPFVFNFGKYKGMTLADVLVQDKQYVDWLLSQADFLQNRPELATALRDMGASPDETPMHNALQAMFLDPNLCVSLGQIVQSDYIRDDQETVEFSNLVMEPGNGSDLSFLMSLPNKHGDYVWRTTFVELKPRIGDEYPTILRQVDMQRRVGKARHMGGSARYAVVAGVYTGIGATLEQVRAIFASNDVWFVLLDELGVSLPSLTKAA